MERKGQKIPVCVCLRDTRCVLRGKQALVKIPSEEELRWFVLVRISMREAKPWLHFLPHFQLFCEKVGELRAVTQETSHGGLVPFTGKFTVASNSSC